MDDVPKIAFNVLIVRKELPIGAVDIGDTAIIAFYSTHVHEAWSDNVKGLKGELAEYKWAYIENLI